jgi:two-component system response regulator FixJ
MRADRERRASADFRTETEERLARLTVREREVLDLLVNGHQNVDIAAQLRISPRTVEVHKAHIMEKLQSESLADLIRIVLAKN